MKVGVPLRTRGVLSFRAKLMLSMMLVVAAATLLALFFAQRYLQTQSERSLHDEFQGRLGFLHGAQEARRNAIAERVRLSSHSVRIRAALQEDDVEDLYANARIELRDVLAGDRPQNPGNPAATPRASFVVFLNAAGVPLAEPGAGPWVKKLAVKNLTAEQRIGYAATPVADGVEALREIVTTPISGPDGALLGALVLGFPPVELASKPGMDIKTGVWFDGKLQMGGLQENERNELAAKITAAIRGGKSGAENFVVELRGTPHLLFYKILNPDSAPEAAGVSLYSLSESVAQQKKLRGQIVTVASLLLAAGLVASHVFSANLSKPVERLAEDSARHLVRSEKAEAALELTEQKYRSIFENAVEGIFLLAPDGSYLSVNPAMARIFGCDSPANLIGEQGRFAAQLLAGPEQGADFLTRAAGGDVNGFECAMRRRDGREVWISQNTRAVRDASGALLHFEGTLEDITERKKSADALRALNADLEGALADLKATQQQVIQQERLRALGQMASGIAHDFNNALTPVMGFAELMLASPAILDDKKKAAGYLDIIRVAAKDAASIVARLREFYRSNENNDEFAPVDLKQLAAQVVALTQPKWKDQAQAAGVSIRIVEKLDAVPPVAGDESALREALTNLVFNAVDAMPSGGAITLRTRSDNGFAVVEVADTGLGMTEEVRARCLEPFFSTKGERGTGLGLAMVFGIVKRHDGVIDIASEPGRGTTFTLRLPVRAAASARAGVCEPARAQSPLRVLLVDDEPQVREVLRAFLESEGHSVQTADHGADGLRRFRDGKFDLVITDKAMPGMSGEQMAVAIKQFSPGVPVVLLSGFNSKGENENVPGVNVVACKPITLPVLRETILKAMKTQST